MPELSRFYGIIIYMFDERGARHHVPHFHAKYQNTRAVFSIDPLEIIQGDLALRQHRLVAAWAELHQEELLANWARLQAGIPAESITPLR